jgi:hypothetical protein
MLGQGLEELHAGEIIDKRLFEWGRELQKNRNLAAHATEQAFGIRARQRRVGDLPSLR